MTLLEKIEAYVASQGNQVGGGSEFADLLKEIVNSIPTQYELPIASAETLGGVKVGDGLQIYENGVLSKGRKILEVSYASPFTDKTKEEAFAHLGITEAEFDKLMSGYYDVVYDKNEGFYMCLTTYYEVASHILYGGIFINGATRGESFELFFNTDNNTYSLAQSIV